MATIFIDGFDKYGPISENSPTVSALLTQSEWTSLMYSASIVAGLSSTGTALSLNTASNSNVGGLAKTLSASYATAIGGIRFQVSTLTVGTWTLMEFTDSGTAQCSITVNVTTGTISLRTGGTGNGGTLGTVIATSTISITANSTHYLEWSIAIGASSTYAVYLDGVSLFTTSTGGNTKTTANSTYNGILIVAVLNASNALIIDDLYMFDTTTSLNNAVLLTSPRIETRYPTGDSQTQFTNAGNVIVPVGITQTSVSNVTSSTNAPGANELVLLKITPSVTCTLQSVGILPAATSVSVKFKSVLYTDSAGSPNALTATGTETIGTTSGTALTLPFGSGQSLTGGTSYWIGYITDTSVALSQYDNSTVKGQKAANTYGSGAPGTAPAMTTGQATWEIWGNATGAVVNWASVAQNPAAGTGPVGDNSSINSSTIGNEDLYSFPALSSAANNIYTVAVKGNGKRSDTGTRTVDLRLKSSGNDGGGSNTGQTPGTTYGWLDSYFDSDPNGSITWTAIAANAATAGPKVAS